MVNDLDVVQKVLADLQLEGFKPLLIGGWAEELLGIAQPRPHEDVDVLLVDPQIERLDIYAAERGEVADGHLSHKRVCLLEGAKVELFIAHGGSGSLETLFWDRFRWTWPANMEPVVREGLPVAPVEALRCFRDSFPVFMEARDAAAASEAVS
jgi:hypothetical protein